MKGIVEALKNVSSLRVTNVGKWLTWDSFTFEWVVRECKRYARNSTEIIRTESEIEAIKELLK